MNTNYMSKFREVLGIFYVSVGLIGLGLAVTGVLVGTASLLNRWVPDKLCERGHQYRSAKGGIMWACDIWEP